jgi:mono/diheme cytochrome c family protein
MRILLFLLFPLLIFSCRSKEKQPLPASIGIEQLPLQSFEINPAHDTVIRTAAGVKYSIAANSFEGSGKLTFKTREAIGLESIVLAGLTTHSGKYPLQSGGMIYVKAERAGKELKLRGSIGVSVPTKDYDPDMKLFRGEEDKNGKIDWKDPAPLLNPEEKKITATGLQLYQQNCASCHAIQKVLTGPPLAFVTKRRCMSWLKDFTRNPPLMMSRDLCAKEQQKMYGQTMPSFPRLSDKEIEAIYSYIAERSESLPAGTDATAFDPCNKLMIHDTIGITVQKKDTYKQIGSVQKARPERGPVDENIDTTKPRVLPDSYYEFGIESDGWFNIDYYCNDEEFREGTLLVNVKGAPATDFKCYLIVPSRKIFVHGERNKQGSYYFFYKESGWVRLPPDEPAFIIGYNNFSEKPVFGKLSFTTNTDLRLELTVNDSADIENEIRSLHLDDLQFNIHHHTTEKKLLISERIYQFVCPDAHQSADSVMKDYELNVSSNNIMIYEAPLKTYSQDKP